MRQRQLRRADPAWRGVGQLVVVADEIQGGLTDRIEHLIAAMLQRDGIDP
jgi:hypothetical protein